MNTPNSNTSAELIGEDLKKAMLALLDKFNQAMKKIAEAMEPLKEECGEIEENDGERIFWREAAAFAHSKALARAQAFACRMAHEKARMAMKRRKLMHAEGHFPDMACGS